MSAGRLFLAAMLALGLAIGASSTANAGVGRSVALPFIDELSLSGLQRVWAPKISEAVLIGDTLYTPASIKPVRHNGQI